MPTSLRLWPQGSLESPLTLLSSLRAFPPSRLPTPTAPVCPRPPSCPGDSTHLGSQCPPSRPCPPCSPRKPLVNSSHPHLPPTRMASVEATATTKTDNTKYQRGGRETGPCAVLVGNGSSKNQTQLPCDRAPTLLETRTKETVMNIWVASIGGAIVITAQGTFTSTVLCEPAVVFS